MSYEKSCGAVIFRRQNGIYEYLLILNRKPGAAGHWGFPKGHVEAGESESETALREIREETGLTVRLSEGFRAVSRYSPRPGVEKDAVYFLASPAGGEIRLQAEEVAQYQWCSREAALGLLAHDQPILEQAAAFLEGKECNKG